MPSSSRKSSIQRPATAVVKLNTGSGYEIIRPHSTSAHQASRNPKGPSTFERRRSLPDQTPPPLPTISHETTKPPPELAHLVPVGAAAEKRRYNIATSPSMMMSGARSTHSDRGEYERSWNRTGSNSSAEEILSLQRLRSNSGLSLHTNSSALRRYTEYNADGSTRLPPTDEHLPSDGQYGEELYSGRGNGRPGTSGTPAVPKLLSWEMVEAILKDPGSLERLVDYTRAYGGTENLVFLQKVEQYNKALHSVTALMANISTRFTCMTATEPLNLPPQLSRAFNADIKHVSSSILPGLDMLYNDVSTYVRERILRDLYPSFVQHQLAICMRSSLGADPAITAGNTAFRFEGLGSAFCLTDPYRPDNPVVYASDAFAQVLGYNRSEEIPRKGRFFRGPELDNGDSFVEDLILTQNHRNNRPFWSVVFGCPLKTASGRVRFVLSGLVDVTDATKSQTDVVRVMSTSPTPTAILSRGMSLGGPGSTTSDPECAATEVPTSRCWITKSTRPSSSSKAFFKPFCRKQRAEISAAAPTTRDGVTSKVPPPMNVFPAITPSSSENTSIYSRFMVLQFVPGSSHEQSSSLEVASLQKSRCSTRCRSLIASAHPAFHNSRLRIAFSSLPVLNLLGLGPAAQEAVMYHDVFAVLSELAGSPSISTDFRATVRQAMAKAESACIELSIPASGTLAPGAFSAGLGTGLASPTSCQTSGDESSGSTTSRRSSLLLGSRSKRELVSEDSVTQSGDPSKVSEKRWSNSSGGRRCRSDTHDGPAKGEQWGQPRLQRLLSHWTPLKDADGTVAWVILVITPVVEL